MNLTANYTRPVTGPRSADIDFDTRLALASVGADVLLSQHGTEEAHAAVTAAVAEASGYGTAAPLLGALAADQSPETFESHPVLKRAGDLIRARGWCQGDFQAANGALCALGAIRRASGGDARTEAEAVDVLLERIASVVGHNAFSVPGWNDQIDRTRDDVLRLLR